MINKSKLMLIGTVTALLAGGSSLAMARYGGPNGSQLLVTAPAGGPAYAPTGPGYVTSGNHTIKHHRSQR